jgi:hypothetical protein
MPNEQSAPNFFAVVNDMAKRFVELMQSDYRMKRKVGKNFTNAVASGTLEKSLKYRLQIKGQNINVSVYAKGKAGQYFLFRENGVNGTQKSQGAPYSFKKGSGSKPAKGQMSPMQKAIYDWMTIKGIRLRDKSSGKFKKSTEELKQQVAKLIMFKVRRDGIKGWKAFDYAYENIWDEYESKVVAAYAKDFSATIENQFNEIQ